MTEITAAMVKTLREQTGVGMLDCKKALKETEGDMQRAADLLRVRGAAKAASRAARDTKEGLIQAALSNDAQTGVLVEVSTETDFVARNERLVKMVDVICQTALARNANDLEALRTANPEGDDADSVQAMLTHLAAVMGENMTLARYARLAAPGGKAGLVHAYIHPPGKLGVLVALSCENESVSGHPAASELAHNLCLHIAFSAPAAIDRDSISADVLEREREVYRNAAIQEGKPEKVIDKIVEGRLKGFFKESCLLDQSYVKEEKKTISQLVKEEAKEAGGSIEVASFIRFQLGEVSDPPQ